MNYGRGTQVNQDYNKAKVVLTVLRDEQMLAAELDPGHARKLAIQLLQGAEEAEVQRKVNLRRCQEAMEAGYVDQAAEMVELNGFTDDELNGG